MNEQPGDLLDEAVKLFETLRGRMGEPGGASRGTGHGTGRDRAADDGDVWSRAVADPAPAPAAGPRIATGAPECLDCPVCRAIALARESGPDVRTHLREAGRSLLAAALDVAAAADRTKGSARRREEEEA